MAISTAKRPVQVVVAVGHKHLRASLVCLLSARPALEVVGEAATGTTALAAAQACPPDVIVLDMRLPGTDWPGLIHQLQAAAPYARVILLTPEGGAEYGELAARWGAAAHVPWEQAERVAAWLDF